MNRSRRQRIQNAVDEYLTKLEEIKENLINELTEVKDEEEPDFSDLYEACGLIC